MKAGHVIWVGIKPNFQGLKVTLVVCHVVIAVRLRMWKEIPLYVVSDKIGGNLVT